MKVLYRLSSYTIVFFSAVLSLHTVFPIIGRSVQAKIDESSRKIAPHDATELSSTRNSLPGSGCQLVRAYPNLKIERPVSVVIPPDGSRRQFVVQQGGKIVILPSDESVGEAPLFADIYRSVSTATLGVDEVVQKVADPSKDSETGLLGMAFHPQFAKNGKFYVTYTLPDELRTVVTEMQVSKTDAGKADPTHSRVLLQQLQPSWNHHSGNLLFGPDGFLYITLGDGGPRDDAVRAAQNLFSLMGKILRIDVDRTQGSRAYGIPPDNPFVNNEAARAEIWAYGLRNPWGTSFDEDGNLWLADVGQDIWEEVDLIEKGGNYGWSFREGTHPFFLRKDRPPLDAKFIEPLFEYPHSEGISVIGGFVYRGEKLRRLKGAYLCADWGLGRIWAVWVDKGQRKLLRSECIFDSPADWKGRGVIKPTALCEDATREPLVLDWNGAIYRLASS